MKIQLVYCRLLFIEYYELDERSTFNDTGEYYPEIEISPGMQKKKLGSYMNLIMLILFLIHVIDEDEYQSSISIQTSSFNPPHSEDLSSRSKAKPVRFLKINKYYKSFKSKSCVKN